MSRIFWVGVALALAVAGNGRAQYGDSLRGAAILRGRGCTACHAVLGRGGGQAADLTSSGGAFSPAAFAAELWNHAPEMWDEMALDGRQIPVLSPQDVRDVYAFLYAVRYFEPSGNVQRGRRAFADKQCHRCHALLRVEGGGIGPAVPDWPSLADPVAFLEAMWNHGAAMNEETQTDKIPWPEMTVRELADLLAFLYNLPDRPPRLGRLELGSPDAGMRLFDDLGCIECHSILETDADLVPLAPAAGRARTITALAVAMWNHQPVMHEWAKETGMEVRPFERGQMGQLLSYLMEEGFLDKLGNEKRGARIFDSKGCAGCHGTADGALPSREWRTPDFVAAVWKHGPSMREKMAQDGVRWPMLSEADVADLIAWLNARQP